METLRESCRVLTPASLVEGLELARFSAGRVIPGSCRTPPEDSMLPVTATLVRLYPAACLPSGRCWEVRCSWSPDEASPDIAPFVLAAVLARQPTLRIVSPVQVRLALSQTSVTLLPPTSRKT